MKLLLIVPNLSSNDVMPSISAAALKAFITKKTKHSAHIIDLQFHKKNWKKYIQKTIEHQQPDLIGFSVLSFNFPDALRIAHFIKHHYQITIIFGGVHVMLAPDDVIREDAVDIICTGEGEKTLKNLLNQKLDCTKIKGVWYKKNTMIIRNPQQILIQHLDTLPYPDFTDFDWHRYYAINHHHLPIMASRGCPYSCTYCSNHALKKNLKGTYVRFHSVDHVIDEITTRIRNNTKHGFKFLYFFDDTFILRKQFIKDFCEQYRQKGFHKKIKWTVNVRANLVTDEIIHMMKQAGCYEVRMGVESGNNHILNTIYQRHMTKEQILQACTIIKKHGLLLRLDFILGAPDETEAMIQESIDLASQTNADQIFFSPLYPLPGTRIKKLCEQEQIVEKVEQFNDYGMQPVTKTKYVSAEKFKRIIRRIKHWQLKQYIHEGLRRKPVGFIVDIIIFLLFYKWWYHLEFNQIYRWHIQRYKLEKIH